MSRENDLIPGADALRECGRRHGQRECPSGPARSENLACADALCTGTGRSHGWLGWDDYPKEPVPYDGTVLHALERLLPFVASQVGYRFAATHVPGMTR